MVMNFPDQFGFERDLRMCLGKTLERVELVQMQHGCTWSTALAVRFTDGSRAFFGATLGTGIMNPLLDGPTYGETRTVQTSEIFTKPEYAQMLIAKQQDAERRAQDHERQERREFERLRKRFGGRTAPDRPAEA